MTLVFRNGRPQFSSDDKPHLEPRLIDAGLGEEQINSYDLARLETSLNAVNSLLLNPKTQEEFAPEGMTLLYARKKLIVERGGTLRLNERFDRLRTLAGHVADETLRASMGKDLSDLQSEWAGCRAAVRELDAEAQTQLRLRSAPDHGSLLAERRSRRWHAFLARQSFPTLVGSLILLVIIVFLILENFVSRKPASFFNQQPVDVLISAFYIVLGYFCGVASVPRRTPRRRRRRTRDEATDRQADRR